MVKEPFPIGEQVFPNLVILEQLLLREPPHGLLRAREVANPWRRIDAREERMNARGAPGQ